MKNIKHDHSLTKCLKGLIFAIMLFMPILIFLPNAFYYGFNETALVEGQQVELPTYYTTNEINNYSDFYVGNVYNYTNNITPIRQDRYINLFNIKILSGEFDENTTYKMFIAPNGNVILQTNSDTTINNKAFDFVITSLLGDISYIPNYYLNKFSECNKKYIQNYQITTTTISITDSMSYAWKSVWQNDLFSWTENTVIYTGINATTNGIGIPPQSYVASYLTYIFLLTVIYVIVDIIMGIFTALTHIFNKEYK